MKGKIKKIMDVIPLEKKRDRQETAPFRGNNKSQITNPKQ
jgi:hypothetical protein